MAGTPEYHAWEGMITRCNAGQNSVHYQGYRARGISVCQEWRESFAAFYNHVGPRPSGRHSLDRINNDGNYEPGNVRWATRKEQQRNTRSVRLMTINGVTRPAVEWEELYGLPAGLVRGRRSRGWPDEELLCPLRRCVK